MTERGSTTYTTSHLKAYARQLATRGLAERIAAGASGGSNRPRTIDWSIRVHNRGATLVVSYVDGAGDIQWTSEAL